MEKERLLSENRRAFVVQVNQEKKECVTHTHYKYSLIGVGVGGFNYCSAELDKHAPFISRCMMQ